MQIVGVGSDIVNINRIKTIYNKFGISFLDKNFDSSEIEILNNLSSKHKVRYLAKRFAGKEAVAKAFGLGIGKLAFKDIIILNDENGRPYVTFSKRKDAEQKNQFKIDISLSDDEPFAVAFVVISV
ncbi:MAG TPA: holo-ACP synthase [Candidatus Megaira endosymbiont of Nemacystus decipiens]|nr:holo-ACP synthase [Candidatus Megaera endosymbiont of Nemacystus decipiens]